MTGPNMLNKKNDEMEHLFERFKEQNREKLSSLKKLISQVFKEDEPEDITLFLILKMTTEFFQEPEDANIIAIREKMKSYSTSKKQAVERASPSNFYSLTGEEVTCLKNWVHEKAEYLLNDEDVRLFFFMVHCSIVIQENEVSKK